MSVPVMNPIPKVDVIFERALSCGDANTRRQSRGRKYWVHDEVCNRITGRGKRDVLALFCKHHMYDQT